MKKQNKMPPREVRLQPTSVDSADTTEGSQSVVSGQGIKEGYSNVKTEKEVEGLVRATMKDFAAGITYEIAMPIGSVNTGTPEAPVIEKAFQLLQKSAPPELLAASLDEYENYVRAGNAFNVQPAEGSGGGGDGGGEIPVIDPIEIYNLSSLENLSEHLVLENNFKLWAIPARWAGYRNRIVIERQPSLLLHLMATGASNTVFGDVRQFDSDNNLIQYDINLKHRSSVAINPLTKKVFINAKNLYYANAVPGSSNNMYIGNYFTYNSLGTTHIVNDESGTHRDLYLQKTENFGHIRIISKPAVILPFDIFFYKNGVQVANGSVITPDWNSQSIGLAEPYWDYISLGTNVPPPALQQFMFVENKTDAAKVMGVKINTTNNFGLGTISAHRSGGVPYNVVALPNITVQIQNPMMPDGTVSDTITVRVIDSLGGSHDMEAIVNPATNSYVFNAIDVSKGFQIFLYPKAETPPATIPETTVPPTTVPETTTVPPTTVPETTTIPPTTVPEVTTTVPETTVPPTTIVVAATANGNGDELKELDQLVEKELEKKSKTKKK